MTAKRIVSLPSATRDVDEAADYYAEQGGIALGDRFTDALAVALRHIQEFPGSGSPRYEDLLKIPGLRFWQVSGFPYLIFYVEFADRIEVWHVLHSHRDVLGELYERGDVW